MIMIVYGRLRKRRRAGGTLYLVGRDGGGIDLPQRLEEYRAQQRELAWTGTFAEYFDRVVANPRVGRLAHARICDMIVSAGVDEDDGRRKYRFSGDELFGLELPLQRLVDYFASSGRRLEIRKRILLARTGSGRPRSGGGS